MLLSHAIHAIFIFGLVVHSSGMLNDNNSHSNMGTCRRVQPLCSDGSRGVPGDSGGARGV